MYKYFPVSTASKMTVMLFIAMSSTLAACSSDNLPPEENYVSTASYDRYPIAVTKGPIKMEISAQFGTLQPSQINAISGFARSARNSGGSRIVVQRPSAGGISGKIARETYQMLVQSGISPGMIVQKTYPGPAKGSVLISYLRSVAVTKECGDWSSNLAGTTANEPYPNFGCSMQNNIAAMVVNPDDFIAPEPTAQAWAASRYPAQFLYSPVNKY